MPPFFQIGSNSLCLLLFFCLFFTNSPNSYGHSENEPPVDFVPAIPGSAEQNRAGYGWLNASSEVEADSLFRQECPRRNASGNIPICIPVNSPLETAYRLADNNLEVAFTRMAQENAFEYLLLQRAAISFANPAWDTPPCMRTNPKIQKMKDDLEDIKRKNDPDLNSHIRDLATSMKVITDKPEASRTATERSQLVTLKRQHLMAVKLRAVRASVKPERMAQAFLLDKHLAMAQSRACSAMGIPRKCMSIRRNRDRTRQAFPSVFGGGLTELDGFANEDQRRQWEEKEATANVAGMVRCGATPRNRFEKSIYQMMGYNGAPNPIPGAGSGPGSGCTNSDQNIKAISRGQSTVDTAFADDTGYRNIVSTTNRTAAFTTARTTGFDAYRGVGTPATTPVDARMSSSYLSYSEAATEMNHVQELTASNQVGLLCERNSLKAISQFQPQAIRQAVLDQNDPRSREGLTRLMCKNGIMERFQADDPTLECTGVTGDPNSADGMSVDRKSYPFPFANNAKYKLKKLPDGTLEVATKINYRFTYDPSIDPSSASYAGDANVPVAMRKTQATQQSEFDTNTTSWVSQTTTWFNSMTARVPDPKMQFKIEKCSTCSDADTPRVSVSPCFRRTIPDNFTADFPGQTFDQHRCWYKNGVNKSPNWQDAGNFTTTMNNAAIMHETGHNLSLADEYTADYYPSNPTGENGALSCNSTMASTNGTCHTLYPRHLLEITRPARACPRP